VSPRRAAPVDSADLVPVRLLELPVGVHARAREHSEALRREFQLIAQGRSPDRPDESATVPERLLELTAALTGSYARFTTGQDALIEDALDAGREHVDLSFRVPAEAALGAAALGAMLDEADDYCRQGRYLLTLATPPDLVTYRRWYLGEFVHQIAGHPPRSWPQYAVLSVT
jgi:hypothetical protein